MFAYNKNQAGRSTYTLADIIAMAESGRAGITPGASRILVGEPASLRDGCDLLCSLIMGIEPTKTGKRSFAIGDKRFDGDTVRATLGSYRDNMAPQVCVTGNTRALAGLLSCACDGTDIPWPSEVSSIDISDTARALLATRINVLHQRAGDWQSRTMATLDWCKEVRSQGRLPMEAELIRVSGYKRGTAQHAFRSAEVMLHYGWTLETDILGTPLSEVSADKEAWGKARTAKSEAEAMQYLQPAAEDKTWFSRSQGLQLAATQPWTVGVVEALKSGDATKVIAALERLIEDGK